MQTLAPPKSQLSPEQVAAYRAKLEADPAGRIERLNGFTPWSKQREIINSLHEHRRVAVQSSHGVGKTAVAAAIVEDFMRWGPCRVVTTAPTWYQVETLLWSEIRKRARSARVRWERQPSKTKWTIREDWAAFGLSTNEPERFAGHHGRRLLFVVDEASGVDEEIFTASRGFLTGADSYVLMIGNPTRMTGSFYRNCQPNAKRWHRIQVSAMDTPAFTGETVHPDLLVQLPSREWVEEMKDDWGEDSPEFRVRVLGEFAPTLGRLYFPQSHVERLETVEPHRVGYLTGDVVKGSSVSFTEDRTGDLSIWQVPDASRRYVIFADVAGQVREDDYDARTDRLKAMGERGNGEDFCCAVVLDLETGEQVAELHAQMDPDQYGRALARLGFVYRGVERAAWVGVESNNMGQATLGELKNNVRYPRLWRRARVESARGAKAPALGLVTTRDSRERILSYLGATLRSQPQRLKSPGLKAELQAFVKNELGFGAAAAGFHDDRVIATGGALEMRDQVLRRPGSDAEVAA